MLTPREAALVMGISYPTIKKCILDGRLKTTKTPGGHHRLAQAEIDAFLARQAGKAKPEVHETLPQISGMNQLQGEVASIRCDGLVAQVVLAIGDRTITAIIPTDAASEMGLKVGDVATALVKQTDVMVGCFTEPPKP
jgi:molybdopterin-binding protein